MTGFPRKHTFVRVYNLFLNQISRRILKGNRVFGYPVHLSIESTNICNLQCPMCSTGQSFSQRKKGKISLDNFKKLIDEIGKYLYVVGPFNLGEPLLHEEIFDMISYAQKSNISTILGTNGMLITKDIAEKIIDSQLEKLVISVDAATQETYQKNRPGGDFNILIKNIEALVLEKKKRHSKTPFIAIQMIVMKNNEHEIENFKNLAKDLGVDKYVLTMFWEQSLGKSPGEKATSNLHPYRKKYKNLLETDSLVGKSCRWAWSGSIINWDGTVVPCCYDYNETYKIGNVFNEPFKNLWNNQKYRYLRKEIKNGRKNIPLCSICPLSIKT
ncbi:MAG: radical SAM protein [Candidatus Omnitrophica bacterium]|nr:radical SAM protein [Candidatus Omnitrophota bacterium]